MTSRDDFRTLAEIDQHHGRLQDLSDEWLDRKGVEILVQRDTKPIVVAAVLHEVCPVDRDATFRVKFWLTDPTRDGHIIQDALLASMVQIGEEMDKTGETACWGFIPHAGAHLIRYLNKLERAGVGRWETTEESEELGRIFIADLEKAKRFAQ